MYRRPALPRRPIGITAAAATLSSLIAIGLFASIAQLFMHDGAPLEAAAIAAHACSDFTFASEREACARSLALPRERHVASR